MSHHFERGQLLLTQNRPALAAEEFRAALAEEPNDAQSHALLAQCLLDLNDPSAALREADEAVRCAPLHFLPHTIKAAVLLKLDRLAEAEIAATEAVSNDPFTAWPFGVLANVRFARNNWAGCLEAANRGLLLDPTDAGCLSLRTMANLRLGRKADAAFSAETALRHDPNDPFAHVAEGWRRMHVGEAKGACEHFRIALRLDPTNEGARIGMIEALKARYWVYRRYSLFQLWLSRQDGQYQWFLILGLFFLMRALSTIRRQNPELDLLIVPLMVALVLFGLMTWMGNGLFNLLLLFHPLGRRALNRAEKREGAWLGGLLLVGLGGFATIELRTHLASDPRGEVFILYVGLATLLSALMSVFSVAGWYRVATGWPRRVLVAALLAAWCLWGVQLFLTLDVIRSDTEGALRAAVAAWRQGSDVQFWATIGTAIGVNILTMKYPNRD